MPSRTSPRKINSNTMYFCFYRHNAICAAGLFFLLVTSTCLFKKVNPMGIIIMEKEEIDKKKTTTTSFVTAGYLPDYRFYINHLNQTVMHLTDLILFSINVQPVLGKDDMLRACYLSDMHFAKAKQAAAYRKEQLLHLAATAETAASQTDKLRLWVSIGGAGRSNGYKELYNNKTAIKDFVHALLKLVREHDLSGVDFDNEGIASQADFVSYTKLLQKIIVPTLKKHEPELLVSVTLHVGMTLPLTLYQMIDRINLMAYDLPHAELAAVEKHVDTLIQSGNVVVVGASSNDVNDDKKDSISSIASKIVLGFPAYGRHRQKVQDVKTFAEIIDDSSKSSSSETLSSSWSSSSLIIDTRTEWDNYVFDSPQVVRQKALLAKQKGLAGIFMWELGQDKEDKDLAPGGFLAQAMSCGPTTTTSEQRSLQQGNDDSNSSTPNTTPQGDGEL